MDNEQPEPQRPLSHRLMHTIGEVLLSFLFAGGVFLGSVGLMCLNKYRCDDFGGLAFFVASFIIAFVVWGWFISLCRKLRDRLPARKKLDIVTTILTVILGVAFFPT